MFAIMPQTPPSFVRRSHGHGHAQAPAHRPTFSSPLSSSPIRAASLSPPPLFPCEPSALNVLARHRETQSSPIPAPSTFPSNDSKFRFASRNPRPNPVLRRREDAQESRRRLFLSQVRQRQEDRRWEMRGGEDELLKLEWWRLRRERQQAKDAELARYVAVDPEEVAREEEEALQLREKNQHEDVDALMADVIAQQEANEVDALLSALEGQGQWQGQGHGDRPDSPHFSDDDEDYDGLFMDLISRQQEDGQAIIDLSQDVEMT